MRSNHEISRYEMRKLELIKGGQSDRVGQVVALEEGLGPLEPVEAEEEGGAGADPLRPPVGHSGRRTRSRPRAPQDLGRPRRAGGWRCPRRALRAAGPARHSGEQGQLLQPQLRPRGEGVRVAHGAARPQAHRVRPGPTPGEGLLGRAGW